MVMVNNASLTPAQLRIIGKGMSFPLPYTNTKGSTGVSEGFDRINQSIRIILSTPVGTRAGNRKFGCKINTLIFEPNDLILADLLQLYVAEALQLWEPRINVADVVTSPDPENENIVNVDVYYFLRNSNILANMVYPFKKRT